MFGETERPLWLFRSSHIGIWSMVGGMISPRLLGISLGYFMVLLDATILNVALPDITRDLGGDVASQQWAVNAYTVAFGSLLLSSGAIADRYGASRVFRIGLAGFGLVSLWCALSPTMAVLIGLRAVQGATAAALPSSTLALLGLLYTEPGERGRAIGLWAAVTGLGFAAGPLLGGVLVGWCGWRAVFLVNVPVAVLGLMLTRNLPRPVTRDRPLDLRAQAVAVGALALLIDTVIEVPRGRALLPGALTVVAVLCLVAVERRSVSPAFSPVVLRVPRLRQALMLGAVVQFQMSGALFVLGLYLLEGRGESPALAGIAFLPMTAGPLLAPVVGRLATRTGAPPMIVTGLALTVLGNALTAAAVARDAPIVLISLALLLVGVGLPLLLVPLTGQVVGSAPAGTGGTAGGLFNAFRQFGGGLGVAVLGAVVAGSRSRSGTAEALGLSAAVVCGALIVSLRTAFAEAGPGRRRVASVPGRPGFSSASGDGPPSRRTRRSAAPRR